MARRRRNRERTQPTRLLRTKRLLLSLLAVMILGGAGYALHSFQMRRQATVLLEMGRKASADNDPTRAVEFYKQYLAHRPGDVDATAELAGVYEELSKSKAGFAQEAIALLEEKVLGPQPTRHADRLRLAKLYFQTGKTSPARQNLNQLLNSGDPKIVEDPEVHLLLARCDRRENKPDEARKSYEHAIATGQAPASTSLELATFLRYDVASPQSIVDADAAMNRLIERSPQEIDARLARCRYRLRAGDRRGAREDIEHAYNLPGGNADSEIILQLASLTALDDPKFARTLLEQALKNQPDKMALTLGLAEMMIATADEPAARQLLLDSARKLGDDDPYLLDVGDRLIDLKNYDAALIVSARLTGNERTATAAKYLEGRATVLRGDWPRAIPLLEASLPALVRNTNLNKKAHLALALAHGAANDWPNQLRYYEAAWAIDPSSTDSSGPSLV